MNQSKSSSTKNILKLSKNIENLYETIVSDSEDTKKYDKEMKEYLNEHNYKKSNDVSPKMIYQQINNSKNIQAKKVRKPCSRNSHIYWRKCIV